MAPSMADVWTALRVLVTVTLGALAAQPLTGPDSWQRLAWSIVVAWASAMVGVHSVLVIPRNRPAPPPAPPQ